MHHGNGTGVPAWANALVLAEKGWGHPEDIMRRKGGVKWAARQAGLDKARARSNKIHAQKNKK